MYSSDECESESDAEINLPKLPELCSSVKLQKSVDARLRELEALNDEEGIHVMVN